MAVVAATISQLAEIGIDEDITGKEVKVYDIDKYGGMYPPCALYRGAPYPVSLCGLPELKIYNITVHKDFTHKCLIGATAMAYNGLRLVAVGDL